MSSGTPPPRWQFWIDRGGTFTDIVGKRPDGSADDNAEAPLGEPRAVPRRARCAGFIRRLLGLGANERDHARARVESVKMGTTVATNALLFERKGEPTLLVTTKGFRDALRIGYQERPKLFEPHIVLPELLYAQVIEADERVGADGALVRPLDEAALAADLAGGATPRGLASVAIVFMHGWRFIRPRARRRAAGARNRLHPAVSVSHRA